MPISINWLLRVLKKLDPHIFVPLKNHIGKTGQIHFKDRPTSIYFSIAPSGIIIEKMITSPDMVLSGTAQDFIKVFLAKDQNAPVALFTKHHISISGDTALLATLHQAFLEQELDWEGHLAFFIGNTPALMINTLAQKTFKWSQKLMDDRKRDLTLFLQEEQKINPTAFELNHFYDEVDALCEATDRLEHRLLEIQRDGLI